jgi:hypothetical protein
VALPEFRSGSKAEKIAQLLQHGDTPSLLGQLQAVSLKQAQLEVSIQTPILDSSFDTYGLLLTNGWFKSLWRFVLKEEIVLKKEDPVTLPLQREGDEFVKEKLIRICDWLDRLGNYQVQLLPNKDASPDHGRYHPRQRCHASTTNEVLHAK